MIGVLPRRTNCRVGPLTAGKGKEYEDDAIQIGPCCRRSAQRGDSRRRMPWRSPPPSRNVQMSFLHRGALDIISRAIAQRLTEAWGKNVVVDNRPGASGMIGTEIAVRAEPDGHTLLGHTSSYPATASGGAKLPFDPARAIVPVATFAKAPMMFAIHPSVPAKSIKELVAIAKKNPGKLNYSSSGAGGNNHFAGALFASAAGVSPHILGHFDGDRTASGEVRSIASAAAINPQLRTGWHAAAVPSPRRCCRIAGDRAIRRADTATSCGGIFAPAELPTG